MYAVSLLPFERWLCLLLIIGLALILAIQFIGSRRQCYLLLTHTNVGWTLETVHPEAFTSGALVQAGYRGAWLIILVVQAEDTALHRVAIWKDQVSSRQFSYLHQQLAFAAEPPARRRPTLWLRDCFGMQPDRHWRHDAGVNTTLRKQTRSQAENTLD